MRVSIDGNKCQGHAVCNMHAPEVFGLQDNDGFGVVLVDVVPPEHEDAARRAVLNCPERAIEITDG